MKTILLSIVSVLAVSFTPVLAQVVPVPSDKQTYTRMVLYQCFLHMEKTPDEANKLSRQMCSKSDDPYVKALLLMNETRYQDALACFSQVPKTCPYAFDCYFWRAYCLLELGKKKEAMALNKLAAQERPNGPIPYEYRAFIYEQNKKFAAARHELEAARKKFPDHKQALTGALGDLDFEEGKFAQALKIFEQAIVDNPTNAGNYSFAARCYLRLGQYELNLDRSIQAVKADPASPYRRALLGLALEHAGRYKEAIAEYDCAMKMAPSYSQLHDYKGNAYLSQRDWKSAIDEFSTYINQKKREDERAKKAVSIKPPVYLGTIPPIPVTSFRDCLASPYNRPIVRSAFAWLPAAVTESLYKHGVKIVVAPTIKDYYISLEKNTQADNLFRPDKEESLDNVCGRYIRTSNIIVIAENGLDANDTGKDKVCLVLHELGHAYDDSIGQASDTPTFKIFYAQDLDAMPVSVRRKNEFYQEAMQQGCGQVFADIFASRCIDPLCLDPQSKELAQNFPRTYKYMKEILPARQTMN